MYEFLYVIFERENHSSNLCEIESLHNGYVFKDMELENEKQKKKKRMETFKGLVEREPACYTFIPAMMPLEAKLWREGEGE